MNYRPLTSGQSRFLQGLGYCQAIAGNEVPIPSPRTVTTASDCRACPYRSIISASSANRRLAGKSGSRTSPACGTLSDQLSSPKSVSIVIRIRYSALARSNSARSQGSGPRRPASSTMCPLWSEPFRQTAASTPVNEKLHYCCTDTAASVSPAITACA